MVRKRKRLGEGSDDGKGGGSDNGKSGGSSSKKLGELDMTSDIVDEGLWVKGVDEGGGRGGGHGGVGETYSSSTVVEGFINGMRSCGKPLIMGEERVKESTRKLLVYLCEFVEGVKVEEASDDVLKALPGLLAWAKEVCLSVRGGGGYGAPTKGGGMSENSPKNLSSPRNQKLSSPLSCSLKETSMRYFDEDDTKYRDDVLSAALQFATACLGVMTIAPGQYACKEGGDSGMVLAPLSLHAWDGLQAVVVVEAAAGIAAAPPQLNCHFQWARGDGGGNSSPTTTLPPKQLKCQLWDYHELDFWKMPHFKMKDATIHLPDYMVHELQSLAAEYFVTAAQQHAPSLRPPRLSSPLAPFRVSSPRSPSCGGRDDDGSGVIKGVYGITSLCPSNSVGACILRWACRVCGIIQVITKDDCSPKAETVPSGVVGVAHCQPLLFLSAVRRLLFVVRKGIEAAKRHHDILPVSQADKLEVWKLSTELMDSLLMATEGLIQSVECRSHHTSVSSTSKAVGACSPTSNSPPSTLSELCMALSRTLNVIEGGAAVSIENIVPEALDDIKFLAVSHEPSTILAGEQCAALSIYCAARIIACLPGKGAFANMLKQLGLEASPNITSSGEKTSSQVQKVKEGRYMPPITLYGQILSTSLRTLSDLLKMSLRNEGGGDMGMSNVQRNELLDDMSRAGRKCFLVSPAMRLGLFLEEFMNSIQERGRRRASWCCNYGDDSVGDYNIGHFENDCKDVMAVPRAVADRLILTLVASMASERISCEALTQRGIGIRAGHVSSLSPFGTATLKLWSSDGSVARQVIAILHFFLRAASATECQINHLSTDQCKGMEDDEPPSTARLHTKHVRLVKAVNLAENEGDSLMPEAMEECGGEGTTLPTSHPLVVNQTTHKQFALLFTAALEEDHFAALAYVWRACECWNLHETSRLSLSSSPHHTSPTPGRIYPKQPSAALSWMRIYWVAWEGLLQCLETCCSTQWEPQTFQFLNGNGDAVYLVRTLLEKLPLRAMAGTLRSSSGGNADVTTNKESLHHNKFSSVSLPFTLSVSDMSLLRKCLGGVLARVVGEGGSAQVEGIFPPELLVAPWDRLLEYCTSGVKIGRGFGGCVSVLHTQLLASCYVAMESKERKEVTTRAFSACHTLIKDFFDLQSTNGASSSGTVVEFEDMSLNAVRWLPSTGDGLNLVSNSLSPISALLGHVLFLLCFVCGKLTNGDSETLQGGGGEGKQDKTVSLNRLLPPAPNLGGFNGNVASREVPPSCYSVTELVNNVVNCADDAIERPPRPWERIGHAKKVCLGNVVDVYEMRTLLLNVLSSAVILAQPQIFHGPNIPVGLNAISSRAEAEKRCIEGCFLFFAAWKLLAYLPSEDLISLTDSMRSPAVQEVTAIRPGEGHPEAKTMSALWIASYARSVLMLLPSPESEFSSSHEKGGYDKVCSQLGSPYFDGLLQAASTIDLREISNTFQERLRWSSFNGAELEEFPNGIFCDDVNLMGGCEEAGRRGCESSEVEDSNETMIDSSSALNPTSEGDTRGGVYHGIRQNWEGGENDGSTLATSISRRREAHASLQAVGVCVQAACASAQSEARELKEAGLSFSSDRTDSVVGALSHCTSLFERCLEHFLFILKGGLMELYMIEKDWNSQNDVKAAENAIEVLMLIEWPDIKEAAVMLDLPVEHLEVLRDTITAPPLSRVQLGSDFQRSLSLRTASSSAHFSPSSTACMEPERVALARGSASQCMWEYVLNICIAIELFPNAGTTIPISPTTSQQKERGERAPFLSSPMFAAILEECTSVKNVLLEVFDGLLAILSLTQTVIGNEKPNGLSVDLANAILLANESLAHPWLSALRLRWMNTITEMQGGNDRLAGEVADVWKIHSAGHVLSILVQQPSGLDGQGAMKAALHAIALLRTLVQRKGPRILQEYYLSGIETPEGVCRRPQTWEYRLLDMFSAEVSDAVPSLVPIPDVCDLLRFIATVPEHSKDAMGLLKNLVCKDDGLEDSEWDNEWPVLISPLVNLLVSWTKDELRYVLFTQLDQNPNQNPNQKPLSQQSKQSLFKSPPQCDKSSQAKEFIAVLCSLLGWRHDDGLVKDGAVEKRTDLDVEEDLSSVPPLSELAEAEEGKDTTGGGPALAFDEESEKDGSRSVATLSSEEARQRRKMRRSFPDRPPHHSAPFRPARISRKPFNDMDDKIGFTTKPCGSYVVPGCNKLRHRVLDVLIHISHSWLSMDETHCSNSISNLAVWLASKCDKLPRLLSVLVEVGLKMANPEDAGFPRVQPFEGTSYSHTVRLRSILKCVSLAKHLLDSLSRLGKTNKQSGSDMEILQLKATLDDLELVPQLCTYNDGVTESFEANRNTKGIAAASEPTTGANRCDETPIKSEEEKRTCTYVESSGDFVEQHWYNCFTCGLVGEKGCCSVCIKVCHAGHSVSYSRFSSYFCDCGAGEGPSKESRDGSMAFHPCKCLNPIIPEVKAEKKDQWLASSAPHEVTAEQTNEKGESVRSAALALKEMSSSSGVTPQCGQVDDLDLQGRHPQQQSSALLPAVWSKSSQNSLYNDMNWLKGICLLLRELLTLVFGEIRSAVQITDDTTTPYLTPSDHPLRIKALALGGGQSTDLEGSAPHQLPSICAGAKKLLLCPFWCAKQGTFNVASQVGNSQEQQNHIMSGRRVIKRCIDADSRGRIAITENKHVLIVDLTNFLMGPERKGKGQTSSSFTESLPVSAMADRSYIGTLNNTDVGFDVIGLAFNPENEQHLAVWGMSRVVVLTGQNKASILGEPRSQLKIDLSFGMGVDSSTSILKAMWVPNSQVLLVVVCVQFVRVYDLSKDVTIPIHTLFLPATSSEDKESRTLICDSVLLPPPSECGSSTSLHHSFSGRISSDATTPRTTTSNLAATVLILTNHGKLFSKGIPKPTQDVLEEGVQWRSDSSSSPRSPSPKSFSNQDCEIRHQVIIPSHVLLNGLHHPSKEASLYYSAPTGMLFYCTNSTFVLALAMSGAGDECEVVGGLPCSLIPDEQLGQDGSGSEDLSQKGHQPPPQSIGCVYASFAHSSLFNSKTSGGWNSWSWNTQANATAGSWDKEESTGVVNDRSTLLLCATSTDDSNKCGGLALSLGAKKEKGEGVEIATQTLSWGSSPYTEMPTQPSVDTSSSGELLFKEATFFSPEDAKGMGEVQGMCVCPAFHGRNFAQDGGITERGSSAPLGYPLSVLVLYGSGGLQCFRMVNDECKKQWRSVDASGGLRPTHDLVKPTEDDRNSKCLKGHPSSHDIFDPKQPSSLSHRQGLDLGSSVEGEGEEESFQAISSGSTSWPVDVFEHLHRVTTDPRLYLGSDVAGGYTPNQILSKLYNGDDGNYIMMPRLCGGSVSLHLKHPSMQIAAVRVQVGTTSCGHRPQVIRVMGKAVPVLADHRQWYDFILSYDDMLHCEHMGALTVSVSSTKESGHHTAITGLDVFATERPATPSCTPTIAKVALPIMGSGGQVGLVGVESVASAVVAGNECGKKINFVQSALEVCMELVVEAVSVVSTRSIVSERSREVAGRGNGNDQDGDEQSSLSQLQNMALDTLSHTVLMSNVSKWMAVRKLCRSIIFYVNENSEQNNVLIEDWKNTSLGMIDAAQLKAVHGILLSPQLPMKQLRQCIRFCALVCRDRPDHRNPAIDTALCVSAFFRARWNCDGSTTELAGVLRDIMRCICLETECRRIDNDKRKGTKMFVTDMKGHSDTETEVVGSPDDNQIAILTGAVHQLLLLLCGPSARLSCLATDQLVDILIPPSRSSQLKTLKALTTAQKTTPSRTVAMQQCTIQKEHNNCSEEFSAQLGREETACSDSDVSVANGNDVAATGAEKLGDVDEFEGVPRAMEGIVGSRLASFMEDLGGIARNSDAMNDGLGMDINEEGYQGLDYRCDGCNYFPLEGTRHHCTECADFDLCHTCFDRIHVQGTSPPPVDSGHNRLHRVIAQVIHPSPTSHSRAVIQGNSGDSDGMEVKLDASVAIASPTAQGGVLAVGNTKIEPDQTTTQPPKNDPMDLCEREEEPPLLERRLLYSLSELLFPIFVDKLPTLISIGRAGKQKQSNLASYLCLLVKLSEQLPSICTATLIGVLEQELIRISSDLAKAIKGSDAQNVTSHSCCVDSYAFCIYAKTMSHLCSLAKGKSSKRRANQAKDHKVTEQKPQQHRFTDPSTWNSMEGKLSLQLCELLRSILANYYDPVEFGRVPLSGHHTGASVKRYGRDGTPISPEVAKIEMMTSPSFLLGSADELLIPISKYSVFSYEDQPNGDTNTLLGCPYTCGMSLHHMEESSGCLYPSSPALRETLHGIRGHKIGVTDNSNNKDQETRARRSGRNALSPDSPSASPKYSWHMSIMASLLKLGYAMTASSKQNLPCKKFKWGKEWALQLCKVIGNRDLNLLHRSAKYLLSKLCGSHIMSQHFRDEHLFATEMRQLLDALSPVVQQQHPPGHLHDEKSCEDVRYSFRVAAKISLDVLLKTAKERPKHWQSFCSLSKIPSLDDSWPLSLFTSKQGQSVANCTLASEACDMVEGGGKISSQIMDFESGKDTSSKSPVRALLSLLWLASVPDSLKVGILDLLEKATASLPASTSAPLPIPLLGSTGETTTETQSEDHIKGRRERRTLRKVAVQASESLPALFLLTEGPDPQTLLIRMAKELVLSCPSRRIRQRAANLVFYLWRTIPESSQGELVRALAKDVPESTLFGLRSREWLQLMRNITSLLQVGRAEHQKVVRELTYALYKTLIVCKCAIVNHPNAAIYETTETLLNTSDCYLDQLPCPYCPEFTTITEKGKFSSDLPQSHQSSDGRKVESRQERGGRKKKESPAIRCEGEEGRATRVQKGGKLSVPMQSLDSIRVASRTSESAVIVELAGSYCIEQLDVRVSDAHGRLVKTINIYHHAPAVASIHDLRLPNNAHKWQRCAIMCLGPNDTSATVELPLPLQTRALMFEFASFHHDVPPQGGRGGSSCKESIGMGSNDGIGWGGIQCPRCGCTVIDHHGVCQQCNEVAVQCNRCRHINYEHLDAFLCVECGYCAYGTFNWRVAAKPVVSVTHVSSSADREDVLQALTAADIKARGYQESIISLRSEIQQLVMTLGQVGGSRVPGTSSLMPCNAEYGELVEEMMKDAKNNATMTTAIGGPANNFAVTPFLRSLFVGAFPDDMTLDGTMVETIESDKAGEDMMIDYDGGDEEEDAEAEVEGERGGGNCDSSSQLVAGERTTGMGRGGGSVAKRARNLVVKENRRRGGVHAEARDPCEAIDALDHILSLSLSQGQYLGNGGGRGGELGLSFDDCIHVTRNRQGSSPDFVNAAVAAISRRGDIGFPHVYRTLPTYRNPEGRDYNYRNHRRAGGGLADSERAEVGEKGDLGSAAADPVLNQDPCAQNGIVRDNNAACNQSSSSSRNVSNGTAPAVESLSKLYCGAGRYLAIHLREMCETILALRKSLHHYQLQIPPQPYRQRHYLENVQDRPFISITEKRKNGDGTCYPCNREVTIQLLLTLSSLYLRGFEGQGTVLEDLLLSLLNEGIQIGSSSCRAAARQCIVSILKGSPKRACDVVLKYLEGRFNLALNLFPTGSEVCSYLGDEWLLFRDLLLGPKTLVGYQEEQQQQPKEEDSTSSSSSSSKTEIKESKVAGKGGLKRKAKGALLQADVTSTGPAVGAAASQESWIASELLVPFLFSLQPKQLNAQREILISILFSILTRATEGNSKAMITHVALPTLSILAKVCLEEESRGGDLYTSSRLSKEALDASSGAVWVIEDTCWKSSGYNSSPLWITISQARRCNLAKKYSLCWLQRVGWLGRPGKSSAFFNRHRIASCDVAEPLSYLKYASSLPKHFLWSMLVTPHSAQARTLSGLLLLHLVQGGCADHIDMLESAMHVFSVMPLVGVEEEALPCLALASALWQTPSSTAYMAARGLIPAMLQLLIREADWLQKQEVEWAYSYPVGGGPVGSQCHVRSGDLLLRCAEVLSTFYSSCSAYGFSWASPTPLKLKDATSILQVALKIEGLVMVRTASTTRAAAVCRRILIPFDAVGHVRAGIRALQECTLTSSSAEWNSAPEFTLPISSVHSHLQKLADIVAPPTQVPCFPVFMRREPSHDVYFRGSLTCNPFLSTSIPSLQEREEMLSSSQGHIRVGGQNGHGDPTMDDLRHRIARELDMADAAELLELLVCDFIISPTIPLRLVFEKVWKPHVLENHEDCDSETEDSHEPEDLHPMTITYRLGGVDGEATEDKIDSLDDNDAGMVEAEIKERKAMTTAIGEEGGLPLLLCLLRLCSSAEQSVRRSVGMVSAASSTNDGEDQIHHSVQDMVMHHEYRDIVALALRLLKHCGEIRDNRRKLLKMQAPGILLHHTVEVLRGTGSRQARQFTLDSLLLVIEALAQELTEPNSPSCATITSSDNVSTSFDVMVESSEGEKKSEQSVEPGNGIGAATIELNTTSRIDEQQHTEENERYKKGNNTIVMGEPKVNEVGQGRNPLQTDEKSTIKLGNGDNPKAEVFEGDSYGSSSQGLKPEEEAMGVDEDVEGQHLHFLLDALKEESMAQVLRDAPALMRSVSHLLPFLTYAKPKAIQALADQFDHIVTWEEEQDENSEREEEVVTQSDKEISDSTTNVKSGEDGANEEAKAVRDIRRKCFEEALDTMACDRAGDAIRSTLIDTGFLLHCCHFVLHGLPLSDAPLADWKPYCCRGKLDRALRVLTGLARAHKPSQGVLFEAGLLSAMHRLERTPASISGEVGLLAETLLESMAENNSSITSTLSGLRVKERALKHAQASAQRDKALLAMRLPGMGTTPGSLDGTDGSIRDENLPALPASGGLPAWMEEMNELEEETGLTCMVCREGYGCNPREILGAYVNVRVVEGSKLSQLEGHSLVQEPQKVQFEEYLRQVSQQIEPYNRRNLRQRLIEEVNIAEPNSRSLQSASSDFGGKQKEPGSLLISSTSAFNVLHFSCHRKATSTEKKLSNPKSEWEGAALRNSRMACNSMLPIRNPLLTEEPRSSGLDPVTFSWAQCLDKHFSNIREVMQSEIYRSGRSGSCTDYAVGRLGLVLHDIRLLLIQLCYQENLSSTIGGGSLGNNIKLFWYMLQLAGNVCKTSGAETQKYKMLLQPSEAQEGFGGAATSTVTLEIEPSSLPSETLALRAVSAPFRLVLSILLDDVNAWTARKGYLACDMIRLVGMRRPSGLEGCGTGVKPRKRLMSQVGGRDVGVKRKRCGSIDTNEVFNIEKSYLESVKPAVVLLGLVNKIQSLWPGSADGLLNEDDDSFVSLSEAMQQHLEHLTMDISANDCETLVKEIGCEKFVDDSSLSAKDWLTKFVKEGERLASLSDFETV